MGVSVRLLGRDLVNTSQSVNKSFLYLSLRYNLLLATLPQSQTNYTLFQPYKWFPSERPISLKQEAAQEKKYLLKMYRLEETLWRLNNFDR